MSIFAGLLSRRFAAGAGNIGESPPVQGFKELEHRERGGREWHAMRALGLHAFRGNIPDRVFLVDFGPCRAQDVAGAHGGQNQQAQPECAGASSPASSRIKSGTSA